MKLLLVTHFFPSRGGGIEAVADKLARQLLKDHPDWSIEWFASTGDALPAPTPRLRPIAVRAWHGVEKILGVPCPIWDARGLARLGRAVKSADAVHLHDFAYMGNICAALFCLARGKPFVVTQHIGSVPMKNPAFARALEWLNSQVGVRVLNRARARVFVSDEVRRYFEERGVRDGQLIPNGVDGGTFFPVDAARRSELRAREGLAQGARVAVFAGRFVHKKGIPFVLEMARRTPDVQWFLAGRGPLDPEANGQTAPRNVRVVRERSGASLADLFRVADVLVLPSRGEGFPLVVQEALACGTPAMVESALARSLPDVAPWLHAHSLDDEGDAPARWVEVLRAILESDDDGQRARRAAYAREVWDWSECARQYARLLRA